MEDVNDCEPIFEKTFYHVNISEASPVGSHLVKVMANDADGPGDNRYVSYHVILCPQISPDIVDPRQKSTCGSQLFGGQF